MISMSNVAHTLGPPPARLTMPDPEALRRAEDFLPDLALTDPSIDVIREAVGVFFSIPPEALLGTRRHPRLALARQVGYWLASRLTGCSSGAIGRHFKRDHTTVLHGVLRIDDLRRRQPAMMALTDHLAAVLKAQT
jgi:chromosomal replication initiator protein